MDFIFSQIPGFLFGAVAGAIIMFFVARKNPEWVQEIYEKQKGITKDARTELEELRAKVAEQELAKVIEAKVQEAIAKLKG
jgi:hypothetical protein